MSTASITHRPIPRATAAAIAVAALAFGAFLVAQNHDSGTQTPPAPTQFVPNPDAHYLRPFHSGVQPSWP
jgi:hypothetical protein